MKDVSSSASPAETRKLAAIMFTDMVGFSRQMGADEARMLRLLDVHNQLIKQAIAEHHGVVIKTVGDAFLVDFPSVVHAVQCAQEIQAQFRAHNTAKEKDEQIHVRIGIHLGDIVQRDGDVFGDGVNIAARLQELAASDTVCISDMVYRDVAQKIVLGTVVSMGRPRLKNIAQRFQVYALLTEPPKGLRQTLQVQRLKLSRRMGTTHRALAILFLIAGIAVAARYLLLPLPNTQPLPLPDKPSIIVLPFDNMSEDPEQEYFSDGITEDLTSDLSRISSLFVIARNSAFTYKGKAVKVQEISKELGVRYVLEGSVRRADNQVRITTQLIDATTGHHLWSERYDRLLKDIFALQDDIVQKIVTTLKLQLTLIEQGYIVHKRTGNLEAYDFLLRGIELWNRFSKESNVQARQMYEKAIALDPQYAEVYARIAATYYMEWSFRWSEDPLALEKALTAAQRALALDNTLPGAHGLLGFIYARKQQYEQAITEGERAVALDPNNAFSYAQLSFALNMGGRPEDALRAIEQAIRLNPHYPAWYLGHVGNACLYTGRYAEAITAFKNCLARNPNFLGVYPPLVASYISQWEAQLSQDPQTLAQAFAVARRAVALHDAHPWGHASLGVVHLWQKHYEQAIAEIERAVALSPNEAFSHAIQAAVLSLAGRPEDALKAAEQALHLRSSENVDGHLLYIGTAYYLTGRREEAIAQLRQYLSHYPNILDAHLILAAVYSESGKEAEARAEAAEVLRINPQFSLEVHKERVPIKDPAVLERHIEALRKAGLK
jgi:adenylate cyclase